jgi:protein SCO1/2
MSKNSKILGIILLVMMLIVGTVFVASSHHQVKSTPNLPQKMDINGTYLSNGKTLQSFLLVDNHDHKFSQNNLKGHWSMLFFGFTNCGYVCPTSMSARGKMAKQLSEELPAKQQPQVVMVSVDPKRDSVSRMNEYVTTFNPAFIGLRGSEQATLALEKQLSIVSVKVLPKHGNTKHYSISHSAEVVVVSPDLHVKAFLAFPHQGKQMAHDYKEILKAQS